METVAAIAVSILLLAIAPMLMIASVHRRRADRPTAAEIIRAAVIGSFLFPGIPLVAWFILDTLDIVWMEPYEPPHQRLISLVRSVAMLDLIGILVAGCFLAIRGWRAAGMPARSRRSRQKSDDHASTNH